MAPPCVATGEGSCPYAVCRRFPFFVVASDFGFTLVDELFTGRTSAFISAISFETELTFSKFQRASLSFF
jgi:hypothetical protein